MLTIYSAMAFLMFSLLMVIILAAPAELADTGSPNQQRAVIDVCTTLKQNELDIGMCCDKARGNTITAGERASLVYLCCLGYFNDVKQQYMDKISFDLILHIVKTTDPEELRNEARFIIGCQNTKGGRLSLQDYMEWKHSAQAQENCRAYRL